MTTFITIVVIALAFEAGAVSAWLVADHYFIRPMRVERDKAVKMGKRATEMAELALIMSQAATKKQRDAKKNGLILSPLQVKFPGEPND